MTIVELAILGLILFIGLMGLRFARERASMRTRRKLEHRQGTSQPSS